MQGYNSLVSQPMSLGDCLSAGFTAFRRQWKPWLVIGLLFMSLGQLGQLWIMTRLEALFPNLAQGEAFDPSNIDPLHVSQYAVAIIGVVLLLWLGGVIYSGVSLHLARHGLTGEPTHWKDALREAKQRFWTVLGAFFMLYVLPYIALVVAGAVSAGLIALVNQLAGTIASVVVGAVIILLSLYLVLLLLARLFFVAEAAFVDKLPLSQAISQSWQVMAHKAGSWTERPLWRFSLYSVMVLAVGLAGYGLTLIPMTILSSMFGDSPNPFDPLAAFPLWARLLSGLWTGLAFALLTGLFKAASMAFYYDLRARSQGGDLWDRMQSLQQDTASPRSEDNPPFE